MVQSAKTSAKSMEVRMHSDKAAQTASPLKNLLLINLLLQPLPLTSSHTCSFPGPTTPVTALPAPSPLRPVALEWRRRNDTITHALFSYNRLARLPCCPLIPPSPGDLSTATPFSAASSRTPRSVARSLPSASPQLMNTSLSPLGKKFLVALQ